MSGRLLDVSDAFDVEMLDSFEVLRRSVVVDGASGRGTLSTERIEDVSGVVTSAGPNDLERLPDEQRMGRHISIVTEYPLRGPSPGFDADVVVWAGDSYVVKSLDPYPHFGPGWVQVIAGSIDSTDTPMPAEGAADFSEPANSDLAGVN